MLRVLWELDSNAFALLLALFALLLVLLVIGIVADVLWGIDWSAVLGLGGMGSGNTLNAHVNQMLSNRSPNYSPLVAVPGAGAEARARCRDSTRASPIARPPLVPFALGRRRVDSRRDPPGHRVPHEPPSAGILSGSEIVRQQVSRLHSILSAGLPALPETNPWMDSMVILADPPIVDVVFNLTRIEATCLRADHGYALHSALSALLPFLHGRSTVAVHPIRGKLAGDRRLFLGPESALRLRLRSSLVSQALVLSGRELGIQGTRVVVGTPHVEALAPAANLQSRLVTIKGMLTTESILAGARTQLNALSIKGDVSLPRRPSVATSVDGREGSRDPYIRRTLDIRDRVVVGYAMVVKGLTAEESICLQENGIGGRRGFGCGIFVPLGDA